MSSKINTNDYAHKSTTSEMQPANAEGVAPSTDDDGTVPSVGLWPTEDEEDLKRPGN